MSKEECKVPKMLQGGVSLIENFEVHKGNKYNPQKVWRNGDGDWEDNQEVTDCD